MKTLQWILLIVSLVVVDLSANEDLYLKASRVDGLPRRLAEAGMAETKVTPGTKTIDLSEAFKKMGCFIPDGAFVHYDSSTGWLVRCLDQRSHEIADSMIADLYRGENLLAICRCYYDLLSPLSAPERLNKVVQIGYAPDPLVAVMIDRLRGLKGLEGLKTELEQDPFIENPKPKLPREPTPAEIEQIKVLEKQISELVDISLQCLKQQLAVLDETNPAARPGDPVTR